jgi:hypothetical protein
LLCARHLGVDAVKLPEPDLLDAQLLAALDRLLAQILRPPVHLPLAGSATPETGLGGDQHAGVGMQRLVDQQFRHVGSVGVGRVDKVDAEIGQALERAQHFRAVGRRAPNALAGDAHGAEAQAIDLDVAADLEAAGLRCVCLRHDDAAPLARQPRI